MNTTRTYPAYQRGNVLALSHSDERGKIKMAEIVKVRNACNGGCWEYLLRHTDTERQVWYSEAEVNQMVIRIGEAD